MRNLTGKLDVNTEMNRRVVRIVAGFNMSAGEHSDCLAENLVCVLAFESRIFSHSPTNSAPQVMSTPMLR
jgi:hypothetical protein